MTMRYVPIATKSDGSRVIKVEDGATVGAVLGVNLVLIDGTVIRAEDILNSFVQPDGGSDPTDEFIIWQQLQEIPQNIRELAKLDGTGFAWRNPDGTWRLRKVGRQATPFAYGDASPSPIYTPAVDVVLTLCRVDIGVAFNGAGAQLMVGTAADPDLFLPATEIDPATIAGYEATPDLVLPAGVDVQVTIVPGAGASAGSGRIIIDSIPVEGI